MLRPGASRPMISGGKFSAEGSEKAVRLALQNPLLGLESRFRLPDAVPPFSNRVYRLFWAIWLAAFLLAIAGPISGLYFRYAAPENNSQLLPGSRLGLALDEADATRIRFPVGPQARSLGIRPGDDIVAVYGIPVPKIMPVSLEELERAPPDPDLVPVYTIFRDALYGAESLDVQLTLRSRDGKDRDVVIQTGEHHIDAGASEMGIRPGLLGFVDLIHVIFYPFLLWAAWILHRRNARDAVSSVLSLAILLTMGTEEPSATALLMADIQRPIHVFLYDVGNVCLLAGILLFPHGKLSPRLVLLLATLPLLFFLSGDLYRVLVLLFMLCAVLMLVGCLKRTPPSDLRQQIKWALYGFSSYAFFWGIATAGDMLKFFAESFSTQLLIEMGAGLSLGIAFLSLQAGLLVALLRYRLYDAEAIISRTASIAIVTLILAAVFAGIMEGIITTMQDVYADSQTPAAMVGAIMATVLIHPLHEKVQGMIERRFHRNLLDLREGLPELMRDLREVADVPEFLQEVLVRVNAGVYATRSAVILGPDIVEVIGITRTDALQWFMSFQPADTEKTLQCNPDDILFPIRVRIDVHGQPGPGWLLIGPRPDGSLVGGDERQAVAEMADPMGRALRIVIAREQDKKEVTDVLTEYRMRLDRLETLLGTGRTKTA